MNTLINFVFTYPTGNTINTEVIDMHPDMNGWCVFFPSDLAHQVYPFYTSDERRVSIAGNIMFEESMEEGYPTSHQILNTYIGNTDR